MRNVINCDENELRNKKILLNNAEDSDWLVFLVSKKSTDNFPDSCAVTETGVISHDS